MWAIQNASTVQSHLSVQLWAKYFLAQLLLSVIHVCVLWKEYSTQMKEGYIIENKGENAICNIIQHPKTLRRLLHLNLGT